MLKGDEYSQLRAHVLLVQIHDNLKCLPELSREDCADKIENVH